jgi:purine-binding chemotaxis protein CheW
MVPRVRRWKAPLPWTWLHKGEVMSEETKNEVAKARGNTTHETRYLSFSLGSEDFAVPLLNVREVIGVPECTKLPFTPEYVLGIMNIRGQVITVIDLRKRLGLSINDLTQESAVVVCEHDGVRVGALVDSVNQVLNPKVDEIHDKPEVEKNVKSQYVDKLFRRDRHIVSFLDVSKILDVEKFMESPSRSAA